jgi:transposase
MITRRPVVRTCIQSKKSNLSDEDIYHMFMLHTYQKKSCREIARQFGITPGEAYDIIARKTNSGCCG